MKKIKNIAGLVLVLLLTFTMSCNEEFLNEEPMSFLSPENTFTDAAGLQAALDVAIYYVFDQVQGDGRELQFNHNMSDVTVVSKTDAQNSYADLVTYFTPYNDNQGPAGRSVESYENGYESIKAVNTVIDYIDVPVWSGGDADPERNHLLGSAYFMRAFFYMQLTMQFGNIAFPLNVVTEARQDFKVFNMQGIWDQMIVDLEYAIKWVKPISQLPKGQAPNSAARMLLAKYYILNERFADAESQMDAVINSGETTLFTDAMVGRDSVQIGNLINPYHKDGWEGSGKAKELILPGQRPIVKADAINTLHTNYDGEPTPLGSEHGTQKLTNPEGIWVMTNAPFLDGKMRESASVRTWGPNFGTKTGRAFTPDGKIGFQADQGYKGLMMLKWGRGQGFSGPTNYGEYDIWTYNGELDKQDYRHKPGNFFWMEQLVYDYEPLNGTSPYYRQNAQLFADNGTLLCEDTIRCWFSFPLYKKWGQNYESNVKRQHGGRQPTYILRKAEAYLIRAEARAWQDNWAGMLEDVNIIRERANAKVTFTMADAQQMGMEMVMDERARELYGEVYRHDEMVRWSVVYAKTGKAYKGKTYSISGGDIEKSLSANSFYYDRQMDVNNMYRDQVPWFSYGIKYTIAPKHIWWPVYEPFLIGNVAAVLNQTTGYEGSAGNIEPLVHVVQPAGVSNVDPQYAVEPPE
ncbi:MAG: RagB/SusD family nutrient uptake outer membrane protein [Bacteroidetes bacterium]|nr:RagB/SusD family nutrient uptake outer membrane protein [Bacteroidota bacterium]